MMVRKGDAGCQIQAGGFEAGEELLGAGDAAEGGDWAVDGGNVHDASEAPDRAGPAECFQFRLEGGVVSGDGENGGAKDGLERFAEIAGGKQTIMQVAPIE